MPKHIEEARNLLSNVRTHSNRNPLEEMTRKRDHLDSVDLELRKLRGSWERAPLEAEEREVGVRALQALAIVLDGALEANDPIHTLSEFWAGAPDVNHIFGMPPNGGKVWTRSSEPTSSVPTPGSPKQSTETAPVEEQKEGKDLDSSEEASEPPAILLGDKAQLAACENNPYPGKRSAPEYLVVGDVKNPQSGAKTAKSSAGDTNPYPGKMSPPEHFVVGSVKDRAIKEESETVDPDDASFDRLDLKTWTEALNEVSLGGWEALLGEPGSDTVATWRKGQQELHLEIKEEGDIVTHRLLLKEDGMTSAMVAESHPSGQTEPPKGLLKRLISMQP